MNNAPSNRNRNISGQLANARLNQGLYLIFEEKPLFHIKQLGNRLPCPLAKHITIREAVLVALALASGEDSVTRAYGEKRNMKAYGNLWGTIISDENMMLAHKHAKQGKGWYDEVKVVDDDIQADPEKPMGTMIPQLQQNMIHHTHHTSEYTRKQRKEGRKIRDLYKLPYYPDRIAQWAVIQVIEPILIKNLIQDTYSAIPARGIHPGLKRLRHWIDTDVFGTQYCLKIDAKHYYQSINHEILKDKFRALFKDPDVLWFIDEVIDSIGTATQEDRNRLEGIKALSPALLVRWIRGRHETPEQREQRYLSSEIGLPIGNYFSQYGGNFYFSDFDHYMKETLQVKYYMRYMDDIIILAESKKALHNLRLKIDDYFQTQLRITLKDNWQVFPTFKRGLDYLGYRCFLDFTLLRKSTCHTFKRKMTAIREKVEAGNEISYSEYCSINSYNGWLKSCNHFRLRNKYILPVQAAMVDYYEKHLKKPADPDKPLTAEQVYYFESRKDDLQ